MQQGILHFLVLTAGDSSRNRLPGFSTQKASRGSHMALLATKCEIVPIPASQSTRPPSIRLFHGSQSALQVLHFAALANACGPPQKPVRLAPSACERENQPLGTCLWQWQAKFLNPETVALKVSLRDPAGTLHRKTIMRKISSLFAQLLIPRVLRLRLSWQGDGAAL